MAAELIYLAFANSSPDHLGLLKDESNQVASALRQLELKGRVKVIREESVTPSELIASIHAYRDRLTVFRIPRERNGTVAMPTPSVGGVRPRVTTGPAAAHAAPLPK